MFAEQRQKIAAYVSETLSFERMILTGLFSLAGVACVCIFILTRSHVDENTLQLITKGIEIFKEVLIISLTAIVTTLTTTARAKTSITGNDNSVSTEKPK